jgi:CheY-like chemotaxis protein
LQRAQPDWELIRVSDAARGFALMQTQRFDGIYADTQDAAVWTRAEHLLQAEQILGALVDGVAVVDPDLKVLWANPTFESWCSSPPVGQGFCEALGSPQILGPDCDPFHTAIAGKSVATRLHTPNNRHFEVHVTPVHAPGGKVHQFICLGRDVTAEAQRQQKLDALYQAGRELAALTADELSEMCPEERVELLKQNIRKLTHDLLHYDVIEIRLRDAETGRLEVLLQEGMSPEAANRVLYPRATGNGITGYVAATGKSYLCPDTAADPLYVQGASGARSSLTVPLIVQDEILGTFNVESPQLKAFGEEDLKFTEIFGREIASALNTLQLLTAEKRSSASQSVEAINREVALPVDEILAAGTCVLERYIGHDAELGDRLRQILAAARRIKQAIQKVGEDLAPSQPSCSPGDSKQPHLKGLRLLVVDNDERVRRSAHSILGRFGCVVETARDGKEALTMARLSIYDAMLADIRLSDLSGYEVYHRLREIQPNAQVILMTAYGYDPCHSIVKARQEGLRHVLFKPFRVDQLLDALASSSESETPSARCSV